jgi:hypothetical protein
MAGPTDAELIIETKDGVRYGVKSLDVAVRLYPGFSVISYADGRPFDVPYARYQERGVNTAKPKRARAPRKRKTVQAPVPADSETGDGAE